MESPEISTQFTSDNALSADSKPSAAAAGDHFVVEDLLDFSNEEDTVINDVAVDSVAGNSTDSSTVTVVDSCNSSSFSGCEPGFNGDNGSRNFADVNFSGDLCVPHDDLAELEWLSNFVEESFSSEDLQKLQLISGIKARPEDQSKTRNLQPECDNSRNENPVFHAEMPVPAKARSKRSRAAACNWNSRLLVLSPTSSSSEPEIAAVAPPHPATGKKTVRVSGPKRRDSGEGRKCLHCATDKTPQWRTGPMGPKTLCNACGVRYKSGRLVPEYRPAASPTFMLTKHSNSHRKVMELRRQKEMARVQQQQQQFLHHGHQNMLFDASNGEDFLIHQHVGPDFRQLI